MPGWDEDGPALAANLAEANRLSTAHALARRRITLADLKAWHRVTMKGLDIEEAAELGVDPEDLKGQLRGPPRLAGIESGVGSHRGTPSEDVAAETRRFIGVLQRLLRALDKRFPIGELDRVDGDGIRAAAEAAAWAHGQWVRIHPFGNGNGRISRLIGNAILVRYGLPPVFRLRPRPHGGYVAAADAAMRADHLPMAAYVLNQLLARGKR
jgi:Fic family protein